MLISKRLMHASLYTKGFNTLLDVGSDHGYLPIYALKNKYVKQAIASDINDKPLHNAIENSHKADLEIETILYDGIPRTNADVISICGMGGELIKQILEKSLSNAEKVKRLILAPNTDTYMVRVCLMEHDYTIIEEDLVKEKNHYYEIIVAEKGQALYNTEELYFGPVLMREKSELFQEKYFKRLTKLESIINGITDNRKKQEISNEIDLIKRLFS